MKHRATERFWGFYHEMPEAIRQLADKNFALLKQDSRHPSLQFKKVAGFWSVRVGVGHRALGLEADDAMVWVWIGTHADYDKLVR